MSEEGTLADDSNLFATEAKQVLKDWRAPSWKTTSARPVQGSPGYGEEVALPAPGGIVCPRERNDPWHRSLPQEFQYPPVRPVRIKAVKDFRLERDRVSRRRLPESKSETACPRSLRPCINRSAKCCCRKNKECEGLTKAIRVIAEAHCMKSG